MNLQEGIEKLKELLFKNEVKAELKFETAKLNDGTTVVEWEGELAVGTIVYVMDTQGSKLPLPIGQYQLEDGSTFEVVDVAGAIDNVVVTGAPEGSNPAEVPSTPDAEPEMAAAPTASAQVPAAPKRVIKSQVEEHVFSLEIEGVEPIVVDFSPMFAKVIAENESLKVELSKAKELNKEIFAVVAKIADEPAKEATESTKQAFSVSEYRKSYKESLKALETELTNKNIN